MPRKNSKRVIKKAATELPKPSSPKDEKMLAGGVLGVVPRKKSTKK